MVGECKPAGSTFERPRLNHHIRPGDRRYQHNSLEWRRCIPAQAMQQELPRMDSCQTTDQDKARECKLQRHSDRKGIQQLRSDSGRILLTAITCHRPDSIRHVLSRSKAQTRSYPATHPHSTRTRRAHRSVRRVALTIPSPSRSTGILSLHRPPILWPPRTRLLPRDLQQPSEAWPTRQSITRHARSECPGARVPCRCRVEDRTSHQDRPWANEVQMVLWPRHSK